MEEVIYTSRYFRVIATGLIFLINITSSFAGCADTTVGVENKYIIPDSSFTATSQYDNRYVASSARLEGGFGWGPSSSKPNDPSQYLQIDLGLPYVICAVATQGRSAGGEWVTQYKISLSMDNITWTPYQENGALKVFAGNTDFNTIEKHTLTQPLARYIRFIPTAYNDWKTMRVGIYGYLQACENFPLGMESRAIQDGSITASTAQHPAKDARLHYTSGSSWCATTSDSNPYLQIDLGTSHLICAVATQGNSIADQWVKTYQIDTSTDSTTWTAYQENNTDRIFYGNFNGTTVVRRILYHGIITKFLRIAPKTYQTSSPCLRTEIYGYPFQTACSSHSVGIPSTTLVPDHRFTASSKHSNGYLPHKGRLGAASAWATKLNTNSDDYLQVDLGAVFFICAVATQGNGYGNNEWVKKYKISYSTNNRHWTRYSNDSGVVEFRGNTDKTTVVINTLTSPFRAKFVRVIPSDYNGYKSLRVDLKGLPLGCTLSLGIENSQIPNSKITSSSDWNTYVARLGRLYGSSSWCSPSTGNTEHIQVDLGQVKTVTGIATQGSILVNAWVTSYTVSYNFDNRNWNDYKEGQVVKNLEGNTNMNDLRVNWLLHPIAARYVRITPQTHNSGGRHCLRFDLYGCDIFVAPKVILDTADLVLSSIRGSSRTLTCRVLGEPTPDIQWFNNGTKIHAATRSTLQVQFISAEDVLSKYNCTRQDSNTRGVVCNTFYTCRIVNPVYLPSGGIDEASGKVTVNLNVPEPPSMTTAISNKRSIILSWTKMAASDDVGTITSYTIQLHNQSGSIVTHDVHHPVFNFIVKHLKPYTNYSIRMNAISAVGQGLWSSWLNVSTIIAEPQGVPYISGSSPLSSQSIKINLQYSQFDLLHGPMAGFRIFYKVDGGTQQHIDVGDVGMTTLTDLRKYTEYNISVAVRNTLYVGPASSVTALRTLQDVPDIAPQNTTATKINDTTFLVSWQPLTTAQSNGVVTKYEIFWSLVLGRRSRRSLQEMFNATTQATQYTLYNLRVYANYRVSVRGYTSVGPGPKSSNINIKTSPQNTGNTGEGTGISPVGPAAGAVVAVFLVLAMVVLILLVKRRRQNRDSRKGSTIPLDDIGENESGNVNNALDNGVQNNEAFPAAETSFPSQDDIYDDAIDNEAKPIPVRQFAEYVKSTKATDYARLKEEYKKLANTHVYPKTVAQKPINKKKNRYGNVISYDHSRVIIEQTDGDEDSDYINASYITGFDGTKRKYIAAQGPVEQTFADFWQMIWEHNTGTIVMLTKLKELGKTKCHQYWPESSETYRHITVNVHKTEVFPDYTIRTFLLKETNNGEQRYVLHFQFTVWPDKGVPHYATAVLAFRRKVKSMNPQDSGPIVIHCSAGVGRTGCYIVIDAMLERAKELRNVDIASYVSKIRKDRTSMVQTDEQYVFIHLAVLESLTCGNTEIQAFNLQATMHKLSTLNPQKNANKTGYALEFERLNVVTADYAENECDVGRSKENAVKNRYVDVIPLNDSRVQLMREDTMKNDYINASFCDAYKGRNAFIMTQAPLQNTIEDFWIMVVNYDIRTIVMLNTLEEENEFPQYWPHEGSAKYGDVTVELQDTRDVGVQREVVVRSLQVSYKSSSVHVHHLQHLKWVDKCIPDKSQTLLDLLDEVQQSQRQTKNSTPLVVQCSNGVGRSGTFCAIFSILERMKQEQVIDVFQVVKCIRSNRPGAVESLTQYAFCYQIIQKYLDSFSDYANFSNC